MDTNTLTLTLDTHTLAPFHAAWRRAVEQQSSRDTEALLFAAQERVGALDATPLPGFVRERIGMVPQLIALLRDRQWAADDEVRSDFTGALAYLTDPFDLIPDSQPRYGLLDDALVLEIALASHRHEWLAWHEYNEFRANHCDGEALERADWLTLRRGLLRDAMRRPRTPAYAGEAGASRFHRERHSYAAAAAAQELFEVH